MSASAIKSTWAPQEPEFESIIYRSCVLNFVTKEDDGPGIPEADHIRIFEVGFSKDKDGTGFGLAISRRIVEAHGWETRVFEGSSGGA